MTTTKIKSATAGAAAVLGAAAFVALAAPAAAATYYTLKNLDSKLCLTGDTNGGIYTTDCRVGRTTQQWQLLTGASSRERLYKNRGTGLCLSNPTGNGSARGHSCNKDDWKQNWETGGAEYLMSFKSDSPNYKWRLYDQRGTSSVPATTGSVSPNTAAQWRRLNT